MKFKNEYVRKNPLNQSGLLIDLVNKAITQAGLRTIEQYVHRDYLHDLRDPNGSLGNNINGRLLGAYTRDFLVCPNDEIHVLNADGLRKMIDYMAALGEQFSSKAISYFNGSKYTLECNGFIKRDYDGRIKYLFPELSIFQKVGETTEITSTSTRYLPGVLEEIKADLNLPAPSGSKVIKNKDPVYLGNNIIIFPSEKIIEKLRDQLTRYRKEIGSSEMHILRKNIGGSHETDIAEFQFKAYDRPHWIDVEAYKDLFLDWKELIPKYHGRFVNE